MTPPVLVTGATGRLGRAVIARLVAAGVPVRALSRHPKQHTDAVSWVTGDVTTGAGIGQAVDGAGAIVHLASAPYRRGYTREVGDHGAEEVQNETGGSGGSDGGCAEQPQEQTQRTGRLEGGQHG